MPRLRRFLPLLALLLSSMLLVGCRAPSSTELLADWTLRTSLAPTESTAVHLPSKLPVPDAECTYTLDAQVSVAPGQRVLVIPHLEAVVTLSVDGQPAQRLDAVDATEGYRTSVPLRFAVPQGSHSFALRVRHRWSKSAWFFAVPRLEAETAEDAEASFVRFVNAPLAMFAFSGLLQIALIYSAIYLFDRRRTAYLWFGIQGVTAAFYGLFVYGSTQHALGRFDVNLATAGVGLAAIASVYFTHECFGLGKPARGWKLGTGVILGVALFWHDPFAIAARTAPTVLGVAFIMVYQIITCVRLLRRPDAPPGAGYLLGSWLALTATGWSDLVAWLGLAEPASGARMACVGLAAFSLGQSILLGKQHFGSLATSDALNVALRTQVLDLERGEREVRALNDELQRQIADRSRQLFAALGLIGRREQQALVLAPGASVQGRYEVVRKIGSGGMGTVYEARRLRDATRVALKVARGLDGVELARMAREAQIAATMRDPHVVGILDVDVADAGFLYLVLEYVDGEDLAQLQPRFSELAFAYDILEQVASGLAALHAEAIVHRDLKPANVLVALGPGRPIAKLADFGISRAFFDDEPPPAEMTPPPPAPPPDLQDSVDTKLLTPSSSLEESSRSRRDTSSSLTLLGQVIGTPSYIAPELVAGPGALSPAADLFSFGVMAYELLTGQKPFDEPAIVSCIEGRALRPAEPLAVLRTDLAPAIAACIHACLAVAPAERPDAAEVVRQFRAAAAAGASVNA